MRGELRFPVVYLTGAPATGKSTLCRNLASRSTSLEIFSYSEKLRHFIATRTSHLLSEDEIRTHSASVVTAEDVAALDEELIDKARSYRSQGPFIIDSHPVTKEAYGFRVTGFSIEALQRLEPDVIICLYTSAEIARQRINANAMGRPLVTHFEADMHTQLQAGVAAQYGVILGKPVYLLDSSASPEALTELVAEKAGIQLN